VTAIVTREPGFVAKTLALVRKDVRIELRARDTLPPMLAFSIAVTLLLAFTLPVSGDLESRYAGVLAGFLWVTVLFSGLIGFARGFEIERAGGALDTMLLVPLDRSGLFFSKALANLGAIATVEVFLLPLFAMLFGAEVLSLALLVVVLLVDVGFVAIGTLFAALAAQTRSRELILPILALPALVPVFIGAVELTSDLFVSGEFGSIAEQGWFGLLLAFDVIFTTLGALAFDYALD
jgi:heme exporter protein B